MWSCELPLCCQGQNRTPGVPAPLLAHVSSASGWCHMEWGECEGCNASIKVNAASFTQSML